MKPMPQLLSLCSKAQELQLLNPRSNYWSPCAMEPRSATRAAPCHRSLHTVARGSLPLCDEAMQLRGKRPGSNEGLAQPKASKSIHLVLKSGPLQSRLLSWRGVCAHAHGCACQCLSPNPILSSWFCMWMWRNYKYLIVCCCYFFSLKWIFGELGKKGGSFFKSEVEKTK